MNTEARLKLELSNAQNEFQRLKVRLPTVTPIVLKEFFSQWFGAESAILLEEFFPSIEGSARGGHRLQADCLQVAVLRLVDNVRAFFNSCPELYGEKKWQKVKATLRVRSKTARIARPFRNVRDVQERAEPKGYEYQGIGHFFQETPARQKRRRRMKTRPVEKNPSARSKSQGVRLNPGQ
jgi:hypothetical protein